MLNSRWMHRIRRSSQHKLRPSSTTKKPLRQIPTPRTLQTACIASMVMVMFPDFYGTEPTHCPLSTCSSRSPCSLTYQRLAGYYDCCPATRDAEGRLWHHSTH